jgi:hypothetical protein
VSSKDWSATIISFIFLLVAILDSEKSIEEIKQQASSPQVQGYLFYYYILNSIKRIWRESWDCWTLAGSIPPNLERSKNPNIEQLEIQNWNRATGIAIGFVNGWSELILNWVLMNLIPDEELATIHIDHCPRLKKSNLQSSTPRQPIWCHGKSNNHQYTQI